MSSSDDEDEPYLIDYSTILSNTTDLSINSSKYSQYAAADADIGNNFVIDKPVVAATSTNGISDFSLVNQEFINLGYESVLENDENDDLDKTALAKNSLRLIKTYRKVMENFDQNKIESLRLQKENELLSKRLASVKDEHASLAKATIRLEEKCKQLESKLNESSKTVKTLDDENRKLINQIEQREKLFKTEKIKLEKKIDCLKDRIDTLTREKNRQFSCINILDQLPTNKLLTNCDQSSELLAKKLELSNKLLKDYDRVRNELVIENTDLKRFLHKIFTTLDDILRATTTKVDTMKVDYEEMLFSFNFEDVYKQLNINFEEIMSSLK